MLGVGMIHLRLGCRGHSWPGLFQQVVLPAGSPRDGLGDGQWSLAGAGQLLTCLSHGPQMLETVHPALFGSWTMRHHHHNLAR